MILCDVSILLNAYFRTADHHRVCRKALEELLDGGQRFGMLDLVCAGMVRIATNPRIFKPAAHAADVFTFLNVIREDEKCVLVSPGQRHWTIFQDLVAVSGVRGGDVSDAWLAAAAIEHGCEWWTTDSGFSRFEGLHQRNLLP